MSPVTLRNIYGQLRSHFGYAPGWWPGTPLEIAVSAILVQQCDWSAAWKGVSNLRDAGLLNLNRLAHADSAEVLSALRSISFAPTKSVRLIRNARDLTERGFTRIEDYLRSMPTASLRRDVLRLAGVGQETADCLLLYASDCHESFVVDAITHRIFARLGLLDQAEATSWPRCYDWLRERFQDGILRRLDLYEQFEFSVDVPRSIALLRDFHAQIVELGKHHCLKNSPHCGTRGANGWVDYFHCERHCLAESCKACPLVTMCPSAE